VVVVDGGGGGGGLILVNEICRLEPRYLGKCKDMFQDMCVVKRKC
jgi:hypothetical protein